jgi:hypothetical protein
MYIYYIVMFSCYFSSFIFSAQYLTPIGTDANVSITLYGEKADSGKVPLLTSKLHTNKFERGHTDEFLVSCADLGPLRKLRIGHDGRGAGAGWHLDHVEVEDALAGTKWTFPCGRWFDEAQEDGAVERELVPLASAAEKITLRFPYEIVFYTSDKRHAGTSANG